MGRCYESSSRTGWTGAAEGAQGRSWSDRWRAADVLYMLLREEAREADTEEIREGVTAAFDQHGRLISLEYIGAAADGLVVDDTVRVSVLTSSPT
ncbi:MAG: DUF2283 domain-containing protein [bacterium]|nr:DUF2283 domain-containing protein [bacterium]